MLAAASRYVLRPRPSEQHIAERSSTDLERPWHVETTYRQCAVNQLELEADRLVEPLRAEAETAIAKLQSDASARVELTRRDAEARIARMEADAESRVLQLQDELAQAKQLTDQAKAEARIAHDRIARGQIEANERLSRAWAEIEDRVMRLKADLAQAELRADPAEQWLVLIRREIEANLMPSFAATSGSPAN
jgi:arginine utilization protein RocB